MLSWLHYNQMQGILFDFQFIFKQFIFKQFFLKKNKTKTKQTKKISPHRRVDIDGAVMILKDRVRAAVDAARKNSSSGNF